MIGAITRLGLVLLFFAACAPVEAQVGLDKTLKDAASGLFTGSEATGGGVPLFGNPSDAAEEALGREIAGRLLATAPPVQDAELQSYVNRVGRYVATQSDRPSLPWTFAVIDSDDINAFSAPGGYIFVTRGLYARLANEAELAAVLAHEIAHVNERHHVRLLQQNRVLALGQELLTRKVKSEPVRTVAGTGVELYARALDKEDEFSCDRLALLYAARGGYDPYAFIDLLDRLATDAETDRLALLFKTHPHPSDRTEALARAIGTRWDTLASGQVPERLQPLPARAGK